MIRTLMTLALLWLAGMHSGSVAKDSESPEKKGGNPKQPPNIIWLMAEDISNDLESYGMAGAQTPHLNRLAEQGIRYTSV